MVLMITMHRRRNHGGSGGWSPPLFSKVTLCLHIRSLPTELEPPFIKPCSYAFAMDCRLIGFAWILQFAHCPGKAHAFVIDFMQILRLIFVLIFVMQVY